MKFAFILTVAALATTAVHASEPVIMSCQFEKMPPMTLTFRGGMGADDNTLQVGQAEPVQLNVGSSMMLAEYGAQTFTFSLRLPASISVSAPGQDTLTSHGECSTAKSVIETYQDCLVDAALKRPGIELMFFDDPDAAVSIGLVTGDLACGKLGSELLTTSNGEMTTILAARDAAIANIREILLSRTKGKEQQLRTEAEERAKRAEDERQARKVAQQQAATEKERKAIEDATRKREIGAAIRSALENNQRDMKFKLQPDASWETFKPLAADMGKHIGWMRFCSQKPYDAELKISTLLILSVADAPSMRDLAENIFVTNASKPPDCSEILGGQLRQVSALRAFVMVDRFRKTGHFEED